MSPDASSAVVVRRHVAPGEAIGDTEGRVIYAVGDIHGCYDLARALLGDITDDMKRLDAAARPLIVMCGDYVDRGGRSADVLAMLLWMERHAPCDTVFLIGNHEAMLLAFVDDPDTARRWLRHGGEETLASYGVDPVAYPSADEGCGRLRDAFVDAVPFSHLDLLRRLPLHHRCGNYIFVHAGLRPGIALKRQTEEDCLWIRGDFLSAARASEGIVVHGHSWVDDQPIVTDGRIGIDTGAYRTGVLTAVRLDGASVTFIQACGPAGADAADAVTMREGR